MVWPVGHLLRHTSAPIGHYGLFVVVFTSLCSLRPRNISKAKWWNTIKCNKQPRQQQGNGQNMQFLILLDEYDDDDQENDNTADTEGFKVVRQPSNMNTFLSWFPQKYVAQRVLDLFCCRG